MNARTIVHKGRDEAQRGGSGSIEAEHLLLAIADQSDLAPILTSVGLSPEGIRRALDGEFEQSLRAVGVEVRAADLPPASPDPADWPRIGASARLALERAAAVSLGRRLQPVHVLLGVLAAEVGTVPRALALAGVDRLELSQRVREELL
jgi:D-alanyl-D-alanine carboxypeptidase